MNNTATESTALLVAKLAPPASVTVASVAGWEPSQILIWATIFYTLLMIAHKLMVMCKEARSWWKS